MKVLWLCNIMLPQIAKCLNYPVTPFGGWMAGLYDLLIPIQEIDLCCCFPIWGGGTAIEGRISESSSYHGFLPSKESDDTEFDAILDSFHPDVIHIWGTEYSHTLQMINSCKRHNLLDRVIISIQGLCSICALHYTAGLPHCIIHRYSFRDLLRHDSIVQQQKKFAKRGQDEVESLKSVFHIIGRTTWDKAVSSAMNPMARYHYCSEVLRDPFYSDEWSFDTCQPHTIFFSQGTYPIKALHQMLIALPQVIKVFPDVKLKVAGNDIINCNSFVKKCKQSYYAKYLKKLINDLGLKRHIVFTGVLSPEKMLQQYLSANVFVCSSSIENSPNSICEAMSLGVPVVASNVGGLCDLVQHRQDGFLYPFDEPYMLSYYIQLLFENPELAMTLSSRARLQALRRHDRQMILDDNISIYKEVIGGNSK